MAMADLRSVGGDDVRLEGLLEACRGNDQNALDTLARWCLPRVRRTVLLARGGDEAEDIVQIAMSRVFSKLSTFRGEASFFVWVDRIAINASRDSYKKRRLVLLSDPEAVPEEADHRGSSRPDVELERHRLFDRLSDHFHAIKPDRRLPLILSLLQGYSVPEIAAILDLSLDTAKMRLRRGRSDLLARLKRDPQCGEAIRELTRCAK
jgi:RNA polymerase sigma-70 factor (ECF subfamily)